MDLLFEKIEPEGVVAGLFGEEVTCSVEADEVGRVEVGEDLLDKFGREFEDWCCLVWHGGLLFWWLWCWLVARDRI